MKRLAILFVALSIAIGLALGVSSYIVHHTRAQNDNVSIVPNKTLARFALYAASERVLSLSNDGVLGNGNIRDTGVVDTSGSWQILPSTSDTLLCIEVVSKSQGVPTVYALWKYNAGLPLTQASISFAQDGVASCVEAEKYLTPYSKNKTDLSSTFTFPNLDTTRLTEKGQLALNELRQNGNFVATTGASDIATSNALAQVKTIMANNLVKATIPDYISSWASTPTDVLSATHEVVYTIPAGGYGESSIAKKSYCISYSGWVISNPYRKPQRGECNTQAHQGIVNSDGNLLLKAINGAVSPQLRLAYALGHISFSNGVLSITPENTAHKKLIISEKVPLHIGSFVPVKGSFDSRGFWCLELRNGNTQAIVTNNLVLGNQFECIPQTVNGPH